MSVQTTEDGTDNSLPSFSTFSSELDPSWDYYDRDRSSTDVITSQSNNYTRPWEMETKDKGFEPFSKLPSFQSQFHAYSETNLVPEPSLPQITPVPVPVSPASPGNGSLTQLTPINSIQSGLTQLQSPSFHTLTAVNTRTYPLVPAPIQARDIPAINHQYLEERHIQLYQPISTFPPQNMVTVIKNEPNYEVKNGLHHSNFMNPLIDNGFDIKVEKSESPVVRCDARKKERRKNRASSLESSAESESSAMDMGDGNPGQVAAISSTASFKSPMGSMGMGEDSEGNGEKQTKKKRKRCGECIGCQKKDNCGDCAPCRNDKSHQICKQRRCEKLTDKKLIYGADGSLIRGESRRGRGKGRGGGVSRGSFRGRKALGLGSVVSPRPQPSTTSISPAPASLPQPSPNTTTSVSSNSILVTGTAATPVASHSIPQQQQVSAIVPSPGHTMKEQPQQPMAPMAFYPTWQADPSQGWQNQFIQQIPQNTPAITSLNSIEFQPQGYSYQPNGYVQTGLGFEPNYGRTYATPVQRYEFQTNQMSPINQVSLQSVSFAPAVTYTSQVSTGSTPMLLSSQNDLNKTISGNDMPGYPRVNSVPPHSLNCNGYSGDYSGNQNHNLTNNVQPQQQQQQQPNPHQQQQQMQHHQQQQQHSNSNQMHPPQVPQSPNRSNMSTPVSQHMMVPTGPGSNHMTRISQSPNSLQNNGNQQQQQQQQIQQSPNHHHSQLQTASRYPSHPGTPHSMQQSPNKNPQMLHSHSGMHTPNPQHNAHPHSMTAMSPNHNMNHVQEWSWNNHSVPAGNNEIFNQSDRVNLNTRLKTMILSKNDQKDHDHQNGDGTASAANNQQNTAQTGHFLSYSHHLRDINPTTNDSRCLQPGSTQIGEPIGGGGDSIWKPFGYSKSNDFQYAEQKLENSVRKTDFGGTDEMKEKPAKGKGQAAQKSQPVENVKIKSEPEPKPKPKRQRKKPAAKPTQVNDASNKSSNSDSSHSANPRQSFTTSNYGIDHIHPPNEPMHQPPKPYYLPKENESHPTHLPVPTPYDPMIKIKQEPMSFSSYNPTANHPVENFDLAQVKMEGYERNYQNFINYADYCQSQNSTANSRGQQQSQSEMEYPSFNPGYNYPSFSSSGYQTNYPNYNQFTGQQVQQQPMNNETVPQVTKQEPYLQEPQVKTENANESKIVLTNYEKEIPVYTYPNPSKIPMSDANQKTEPHKFPYLGEGGPATLSESVGFSCCRQGGTNQPSDEHVRDGTCVGRQTKDELLMDDDAEKSQDGAAERNAIPSPDRTEKGLKPEVPDCDCFSSDKNPPEPGSYYTHLGSAASLEDLRKDFEQRVGITGRQLRIEKIVYTGKEGKTGQGCPLAKWIIRRTDLEEKILCLVKRRQGHRCQASFIVVCIVAWDGLPKYEADNAYKLLVHKLNKFGLPTTRRCATNENRTCACQGLDPESCGASFSFGCSWSMYYNGCKYARSKTVRKFRLSVKSEEPEIEEHMNILATILSPLYVNVAPKAYENQCKYEPEAPDCRLGLKQGKPFSGVTTCIDFCAHSHRDLHNMQDGCTVQVGLLRQRGPGVAAAAEDEQLHVLPLYTMDTTDEFGSAEAQTEKNKTGAVQVLEKFPCEVRVRATPLQPCRRHGKKRNGKEVVEEPPPPPPPSIPAEIQPAKKENSKKSAKNKSKQPPASSPSPRAQTPQASNTSPSTNSAFSTPINQNLMNTNSSLINMATMIDNFTDAQLQSNHISSTVLDSPYSYDYTTGSYIDNRNYYNQWPPGSEYGYPDRCEQVKSRGSEENPDSTTLSTANSAFSPKITDPSKFSLLDDGTKDQGFAKPKPPEYPPNYGYHPNKPAYSPMYPPYTPYEHYNNMDYYSNDKLRYNFYNPHHHQPYPQYNMYHSNPALSAPSPTPQPNWNMYPPSHSPMPMHPMHQATQMQQPSPKMPELPPTPASEPIGEITEVNDNLECFQDAQMGGVGIALGHGSVLIECAKHEMHATTALRKPNRLNPTRITLIFYQHRNLNRHKHGIEEWEEKMRLKKLGITAQDVEEANKEKAIKMEEEIKEETKDEAMSAEKFELDYEKLNRDKEEVSLRAPTLTTTSWTTLFPMHPCVVTGPYQEGNNPTAAGPHASDGLMQTSLQQQEQHQQQLQLQQQQQEAFIPPKLNEAYI